MADATMIPFASSDHEGLSAGLGGAVGAFLGSWFMNGWGGYGWGGFGRDGYPGAYGGAAMPATAGIIASNDRAVADSVIMDGLSRITDQISGVNTGILTSQAQQNSAMCQGFSDLNNAFLNSQAQQSMALCQGFSGVNQSVFESSAGLSRDMGTGFNAVANTVVNGNNQINQNLCSGFANTVAAVNANGSAARFDTLNGFNQMQRAIDSCCCNTQTALASGFGNLALENCQNTGRIVSAVQTEGAETRALINHNYINELQTKLCDAKAKIGSLESQQYTSNALAAQSAVWDRKLSDAITTIVTEIKGSGGTTPTTTA